MDLVWLVYAISLLGSIGCFFTLLAIVSAAMAGGFLIYRGAECSQEVWYNAATNKRNAERAEWSMGHVKTALKIFIPSLLVLTFLPTERTAYMMVGAYATQKVAESGVVQETGGKVLTIINQKLDQYVQEGIDAAESTTETKKKRK